LTVADDLKNNIYCVSDNGDHNYNHDGIVVYFEPDNYRLNLFLAHGPQYDPYCAYRTNAAAIKAAYEMTVNPENGPVDLMADIPIEAEATEGSGNPHGRGEETARASAVGVVHNVVGTLGRNGHRR
ncbi:hypothetical protein IIA15_07015, partial [candidate division TA06 bacterium]|nr:hypothetical protein [candidate division TA06 bacterium]